MTTPATLTFPVEDKTGFREFEEAMNSINKYIVPDCNMPALVKRIERINRRATKLGTPPVTLHAEFPVVNSWVDESRRSLVTGEAPIFHAHYQVVSVTGPAPAVEGWTFIGTIGLEHSEPVIRMRPDFTAPDLGPDAGRCDHCGKKRRRLETFILQDESGAHKVVGRNCLADFLGGHDPMNAVKWMRYLDALRNDLGSDGDDGFRGGSGSHMQDLQQFLTWVAACIRDFGWVSKGAAEATGDQLTPTAYEASRQQDPKWRKLVKDPAGLTEPTDEDRETAKAAIAWASDIDQNSPSDYEQNIRIIATDGYYSYKEDGYAASIVSGYLRHVEKLRIQELNKKRMADYTYVGTPKQRMELTVTVINKFNIEGFYGTTVIHRMQDEEGNPVVWYCNGEPLDLGTHRVKLTVKKHEEHAKYGKQTVVQRVTLIETLNTASGDQEVSAAA